MRMKSLNICEGKPAKTSRLFDGTRNLSVIFWGLIIKSDCEKNKQQQTQK